MQVRTKYGYIVDIFGYYHIGDQDYLVAFPRDHGGLIVYSKNEVEIIDHVLYGRWVFYKRGVIIGPLLKKNCWMICLSLIQMHMRNF